MTSTKRSTIATIEQVLPKDYSPGYFTVIVGRGKKGLLHKGNARLNRLVVDRLRDYDKSADKLEKSILLRRIVRQIRGDNNDGVGFVRYDKKTDRWQELTETTSRVAVAQSFRDAVGESYKSSKKVKQIKHLEWRRKASAERSPSSDLPPVKTIAGSGLSVDEAIAVARMRNHYLSSTGVMPATITHVPDEDGIWGIPIQGPMPSMGSNMWGIPTQPPLPSKGGKRGVPKQSPMSPDEDGICIQGPMPSMGSNMWGIPTQPPLPSKGGKRGVPKQSPMSYMAQQALAAQQFGAFSMNIAAVRCQGFAPQAYMRQAPCQGFAPQAYMQQAPCQGFAPQAYMQQAFVHQKAFPQLPEGTGAMDMRHSLPQGNAALPFHRNQVIELDGDDSEDDVPRQVTPPRRLQAEDEERSIVTQYSEPQGQYNVETYAPRYTAAHQMDPPTDDEVSPRFRQGRRTRCRDPPALSRT